MCEDGGGEAAGEEFRRGLAGYGDFVTVGDDGFDAVQGDATETGVEDVAEAEAVGTHGGAVGECEDVVGSDVEGLGIREVEANESVGVPNFEADDASPGFAVAFGIRAAQKLADVARLDGNSSPLASEDDGTFAETASAAAT